MRFLELKLKSFGRFEDETIRFSPEIHPLGGFHMIIGPNEAGKSTTLAAFERFLFGFGKNDIYNILKRKNLWVGANLQLSSGECMGLWRKNSQVNSLLGENQKDARPATLLSDLLNPVDSKTYMKLFGLNQDTLREGGKKLVSGEGEFADILFGESLGDLYQFDKIRVGLKSAADELFKNDGRARTPLNTLKAKNDELKTRLLESGTRLSVWSELESNRDKVKAELARVVNEIAGLSRKLTTTRNRIKSRGLVEALIQKRHELEPFAELPRVQQQLHTDLAKAATRLGSLTRQIEDCKNNIQANNDSLIGIVIRQAYLDQGEAISTLAGSAASIDQKRERVSELEGEIENQILDLKNQAFELGIDIDRPAHFPRIDATTKNQMERTAQEIKSLEEKLKDAERDAKRLERDIEKLSQESSGEACTDAQLTILGTTLENVRTILNQQKQLPEIRNNLNRSRAELDSKLRALPFWSGDEAAFHQIHLPLSEAVESAERNLAKAQSNLESARHKCNQLIDDIKKQEKSIAKRREQLTLPSLEELLLVRQDRDEAWAEIDARWRQSVDMPAHEKSVRSDLLSQLLKTADRMADQLRDRAEIVADMLKLEDNRAERDTAQERLADETAVYEAALEKWQSFWNFLNEKPLDPATVKPWLAIGPEVEKLRDLISRSQSLIDQIESLWPSFCENPSCSALTVILSESSDPEVVCRLLSQHRDHLNSQRAIEKKKLDQIQQKKEELEALLREMNDKLKTLEEQQKYWNETLKAQGMPGTLSPDDFAEYAATLARFHQEWQRYCSSVKNRQDFTNTVLEFDTQVHKIAEIVGFPEDTESTTQTTRLMNQELGREREKLAEMRRLEKQISIYTGKSASLNRDKTEDEAVINRICQQIGVERLEFADERFKEISRRDEIEKSIDQTISQLSLLRGETTLESWMELVSAESADEAAAAESKCQTHLTEKEEQKNDLLKQLGAWNNRKEEIEKRVGQARLLDARNEQSLLVETTQNQIRNYLKYSLTNKILEEAAQDYRKRMGDDVLKSASEYFRALSLNSFDGIRPEPGEKGGNTLYAVRDMNDPESKELKLHELSEGTRDQLFLALKLAMIRNRLVERQKQGQTPLPVILDDILVQFDDDRSAAAFRLLGELSQMTQVIFLTHHTHLEDVAKSAFGDKPLGIHRLSTSNRTLQEQN